VGELRIIKAINGFSLCYKGWKQRQEETKEQNGGAEYGKSSIPSSRKVSFPKSLSLWIFVSWKEFPWTGEGKGGVQDSVKQRRYIESRGQ